MARQFAERTIGSAEEQLVRELLKLFYELTTYRNIFAGQWEEGAAIADPDSRNTFFYGSYNFPGVKKTQQQVDGSTALAIQQFCAIADSLITPQNRLWHGLESDPYVMKDRDTRAWFDDVRSVLFTERYRPQANFAGNNFRIWKSLGAFGNGIMFVDPLDRRWHSGRPGLRYRACHLRECFFAENHQGIVTTMVRWWRMTAQQAYEKFGFVPPNLKPALEKQLQTPYQFLHCVRPRGVDDLDPQRLDEKGMPFESHYVSIEGMCLMAPAGGYHTFPYAVSRYDQMPDEVYGRGPLQLALPSAKTLNAEKSIFLKTGHRASDPVYLIGDDGLSSFDMTPGAKNPGTMSPDGKPLVGTLPVGDVHITLEMMQEERGLIENFFLTPLFKTLMQNPQMTATQVVELINERAMLVAPTLGRQHSEYAGNLVPREISLLQRMRDAGGKPKIPPMPPRLREAMGYYEVTDTSPLALQARASQAAGGLRTLDVAHQIAINSADPSIYDHFNFDAMLPEIGQMNEMPERWAATQQQIQAKRQNRARQAAQQAQIQALPAQAAMVKAQAVAAKAQPLGGVAPQAAPQPQPAPL
jgi:hypothetical protein